MKIPKLLPVVILACLAMTLAWATAPSLKQKRDKARLYYLEGAVREAANELPEAYEYYKKALGTDSTYVEAAMNLANLRLTLLNDEYQTREGLLSTMGMMKNYVEAYPASYNEAIYYAYIASQLDSVPEAVRIYRRLDSIYPAKTDLLLRLADAYRNTGQLDSALSVTDRYEKIEGSSTYITLTKINYLLAKKDTAAAIAETANFTARNPKDPWGHVIRGDVFRYLSMGDSALASYARAADFGPAKASLATYYKMQGDSALYDKYTYETLLSEDYDLDSKIELLTHYLGTLYTDKSDSKRGDYLFSVLEQQYPHEPSLLALAADYSELNNNLDQALEKMSYVLDLAPDNIDYWKKTMSLQLQLERPKEALATYDRAAAHVEPDYILKLFRGAAARGAKDYDLSLAVFSSLLAEADSTLAFEGKNIKPITDRRPIMRMSYEQLMQLSDLYVSIGETCWEDSLPATFTALENALYLNPDNVVALNDHAYFTAVKGGDLDKALEMIKSAVEKSPDQPTFMDTHAWVLFKRGELEQAETIQRAAVEIAEKNKETTPDYYDHLGDILASLGKTDEAVEAWEKALSLDRADANSELIKRKIRHRAYLEK